MFLTKKNAQLTTKAKNQTKNKALGGIYVKTQVGTMKKNLHLINRSVTVKLLSRQPSIKQIYLKILVNLW